MKKIGLIINPIAGMGGSVGLKGTDGVLTEAIRRGATRKAPQRSLEALAELKTLINDITIVTCGGDMGGNQAVCMGFQTEVVYTAPEQTDSSDTERGAKAIMAAGVGILMFAGGDGTARDICNIVGEKIISLGIPAGVKIHSPVYAQNPQRAGQLAAMFITGKATMVKEAEVVDIDEEEYRRGHVNTRLYGYMSIPYERRFMQGRKSPTPQSERNQQYSIANEVIKNMEKDTYYIIGPGSTTRAIMELMDLQCTLIGVDIVYNKEVVKSDASEQDILRTIGNEPAKLVLTPTGGQGYLLGRGNQQISPSVIRKVGKQNIIVTATKEKLANLMGEPLYVDTGDQETDSMLEGYVKVVTGLMEAEMYRVKA